jgi:hypothetical protein
MFVSFLLLILSIFTPIIQSQEIPDTKNDTSLPGNFCNNSKYQHVESMSRFLKVADTTKSDKLVKILNEKLTILLIF